MSSRTTLFIRRQLRARFKAISFKNLFVVAKSERAHQILFVCLLPTLLPFIFIFSECYPESVRLSQRSHLIVLYFVELRKGSCLLQFKFDALIKRVKRLLAPSAFVLLVLVSISSYSVPFFVLTE